MIPEPGPQDPSFIRTAGPLILIGLGIYFFLFVAAWLTHDLFDIIEGISQNS